jgi:Txe/YoeB family toxin of Txe-Axe toxin-antitoxin module
MLPCVRGDEVEARLDEAVIGATLVAVAHPLLPAARRGRCRASRARPRLLERCPVAARIAAVLEAVAEAPPNAFAGGGYWEAMHGTMGGYYEVRVDGRDRRHYRLFCVLEREGTQLGLGGPSIVVLAGMEKPFRTTFTERDYARVRQLGDEYRSRVPRSVLP